MGFSALIAAQDVRKCSVGALLGQAEVDAHQWLCASIPM